MTSPAHARQAEPPTPDRHSCCHSAQAPKSPPDSSPRVGASRWTCPMHPEVVSDSPGDCPVCGMALEPEMPTAEVENPELADMTRRLKIATALGLPVLVLAMSDMVPGQPLQHAVSPWILTLIQAVLATPVVAWAGAPFFRRALGLPREPQPEHVHAHRPRRRGRLALQRRGAVAPRSGPTRPRGLPGARRRAPRLLRGGRRHHGARPPRPGPRAEGPEPDELGHPRPPRPLAEDGAEDRGRGPRGGRPRRARRGGRPPPRPARRARPGGRGRSRTGPPGSTSR